MEMDGEMKLIKASRPQDFEKRDEPVVLELREQGSWDVAHYLFLSDEDIAEILYVTASR